jgi:type II secretory ATPase GspE/PulE/Tfp pilus assembly ATPase PilB-like protein
VERIIARAAAEGASDIHFEPMPETLRVRFRVDGGFRDIAFLATSLTPPIIARIKVLAGMDIAEHRMPQDGRLSATVGHRHLDMRSSTYPTVCGEKAVLRLLDRSRRI